MYHEMRQDGFNFATEYQTQPNINIYESILQF